METKDKEGPTVHRELQGHKAAVQCSAFNPQESYLATGGDDKSILLWNLKKSYHALRLQGHTGPILDLNFSPKKNLLASASQDRTVRLWVPTYSGRATEFHAHGSSVRSVHFSPDGNNLVTGSDDKSVKLWCLESKHRFTASMTRHSNWVRCTRFSPSGNLIGSCADDRSAILWDNRDQARPVEILEDPVSVPTYLAFQPNSDSVFALAFQSGEVRIYDLRATEHLLQSYKIHDSPINQIAFHPEGHRLISASSDGEIKMLDLLDGRPIFTLSRHSGSVNTVSFSPKAQMFSSAGADRQVVIWKNGNSCLSPSCTRTPVSSRTLVNARTPIAGDPRSPLHNLKHSHKKEHGLLHGRRLVITPEEYQQLEQRISRLEDIVQTLPGVLEDLKENKLSGTLQQRVSALEQHIPSIVLE